MRAPELVLSLLIFVVVCGGIPVAIVRHKGYPWYVQAWVGFFGVCCFVGGLIAALVLKPVE